VKFWQKVLIVPVSLWSKISLFRATSSHSMSPKVCTQRFRSIDAVHLGEEILGEKLMMMDGWTNHINIGTAALNRQRIFFLTRHLYPLAHQYENNWINSWEIIVNFHIYLLKQRFGCHIWTKKFTVTYPLNLLNKGKNT
jgi:hypothetical protein